MKKQYKLKKAEVFQDVFSKGARNKYKNLFFINIKEGNNPSPRFGIAVSKKFGHAPYRNYIKRQVRSILAKEDLDSIEPNYYVFVFSKTFCDLPYAKKEIALSKYIKELQHGHFKKQESTKESKTK